LFLLSWDLAVLLEFVLHEWSASITHPVCMNLLKHTVPPKWIVTPTDMEVIEGHDVTVNCQVRILLHNICHLNGSWTRVLIQTQATGYPQPRIWWEHAEHLPGSLTPTHYQPVISNSHIHALENGSLIIKEVVKKDEGLYLCQVRIHSCFVVSNVIKCLLPFASSSLWERNATAHEWEKFQRRLITYSVSSCYVITCLPSYDSYAFCLFLSFVVQATNGVGSGISKVVKITVRGALFTLVLPLIVLRDCTRKSVVCLSSEDEGDLLAEGMKHVLLLFFGQEAEKMEKPSFLFLG
jgi:hypothetical protein